MNERRGFKRYLEKTRAVINYYTHEGSLYESDYFASTHDISQGGARLVVPQYFPKDTNLVVSLDLSSVNRIAQFWAEVKWVEERRSIRLYDIGVEFIYTADPVRDITERFKRG